MTIEPAAAVAIIMRTKNRPLLLERALQDVLRQTFQGWILVIVNDGGDAHKVDLLLERHASALGGRASALHHAHSKGMEVASNAGIRATASEFIAIHDDDDEWHPEFLEQTVRHLSNGEDAGVAVRTEIVWERIQGQRIEDLEREIFWPEMRSVTLFDMFRSNRCVPISVLYRRSVHEDIGYYDESLSVVGDWEFYLRLLQRHRLGFIDGTPLAYWNRRRETSGDLANSVAQREEHIRLDLEVRERHLREYVASQGMGALLYLTSYNQHEFDHLHQRKNYMEDQVGELNRRIDLLEEAISDASLVSLIRRRYRRFKDRFVGR
ncbi:glycosyltransferase [Arthrobacter tumbae]|uniref:glycosyltransferase family 2 protein n=1 Tax=Arthrobacter tumbae TaxID=163874 RepID=UPI00195E01F2|nr:glycosyltransferase family 2 protein [Arthrobacter tumbae]MBM7782200.1 glycosyltransferase involved in cell wall biosynthesis [Arthrobacter tumbae]